MLLHILQVNLFQLKFTNFILQNNVSLVTNCNEIFSCNKNLIQIEFVILLLFVINRN